MNSWLLRAGVTGAVVYGAIWAVRKYDLVTKAADLAGDLVIKGVGVTNDLLTKYDEATSTDGGAGVKPKPEAEEGPDPKAKSAYANLWSDAR